MKFLYYTWQEFTYIDTISVFNSAHYDVDIFDYVINNKMKDEDFELALNNKLKEEKYDFIFSYNYFPTISNVAEENNIKYICWIYDSPLPTLHTKSVFNKCNYIFHFDSSEVLKLSKMGVANIFHLPLGVNKSKYLSMDTTKRRFDNEVSFMGNLYNDEYNFFDNIKNMPPYLAGFYDGIMDAQMNLFGSDILENIVTEDFYKNNMNFIAFKLSGDLLYTPRDFFVNMLRKKITVVERVELMELMSRFYKVTHYAPAKSELLDKVEYMGYIDYEKDMPQMFHDSKININITLRTIQTGIPLRCMDIMASGGFLLSNYQKDLSDLFVEGSDMALFYSREDLIGKIDYYLNHEDERLEIASNAREKVLEKYNYETLFEKIFSVIDK